jgi:hypothetical protein
LRVVDPAGGHWICGSHSSRFTGDGKAKMTVQRGTNARDS